MTGATDTRDTVRLCLAGDVMTGRGVDQLFAHPAPPELSEPWVRDARTYLALAERASGPVPRPVDDPTYPWGDALAVMAQQEPHVRLFNLETAVTRRGDPAPGKGVHYRQAPEQVGCLTAPGDTSVAYALANNHVLDYGPVGLDDTLRTLAAAGVPAAGAGPDEPQAALPATLALPTGGRVLFAAYGAVSSGIPPEWAAAAGQPGVNLLPDLSLDTADRVAASVQQHRRPGDVVVVSLHWGGNWGYDVPPEHTAFARRLVDRGVTVVHGHSSHHPRPMEWYRDGLVLYGCGDLVDDYEGIVPEAGGRAQYRGDLRLLYFVSVQPATGTVTGARVTGVRVAVLRSHRLRLQRAPAADVHDAAVLLDDLSRGYGVGVTAPEPGGAGGAAGVVLDAHPA